jgi:hypothetical protein
MRSLLISSCSSDLFLMFSLHILVVFARMFNVPIVVDCRVGI